MFLSVPEVDCNAPNVLSTGGAGGQRDLMACTWGKAGRMEWG